MKKAIKIILIILAVLIIGIIATPFIFKDKIIAKVKTEINNNVNAKVDFGNVDLTIFKSFPNLTLQMDKLSVVGIKEFEGDTLAGIASASFTIDIMSVIKGDIIKIRGIYLDQPRIQLLVLENGKANWDIAKPSTETAGFSQPSQFNIGLKRYEISKGHVIYDDKSMGFKMELNDFNHVGSGDFTQDLFTLETKTDVTALTMNYGGVTYINNAKTAIQADLDMDMVKSKYSFKQNKIQLNELALGVDGFVSMPADDIVMDLKFDIQENNFKSFISMIPGMYRAGFDKVQASGRLALNGFLKGTYNNTSMPGFGVTLAIADGKFKYPDLPTGINNVQVDLKIANPDGVPDHTLINMSKFHAEMGATPFDARLVVSTPVSDANIDAWAKGQINLTEISKMVPLEQGTSLSGTVDANITAKGRLSSIESKNYQAFNANGTVSLAGVNYTSNDFKQGVYINVCELVFNPKNVTLNALDMKTGKTDIRATGWLDNLLSYMFKENELLKGTIDIKSNTIDINEFLTSDGSSTVDTTTATVFEVPANIDFSLTANVGKVLYEDLILENAKGNLAIREKTLGLNGCGFNILDGAVEMNGLYDTKDIKKPHFSFDLDLKQLDIRKTYDKFIAVRKLAPIAEKCTGNYSSTLDVKGNLDSKMEPVLTSFTGGGKLSTGAVTVENFEPMVKVADALKMNQFKKMELKNINLSFKFENGRVTIAPFDLNFAGIKSVVEGSNGFDQTIDYTMKSQIPTAMMGSQAAGVVNGLIAQANKSGANFSMGKEVKVGIKIGGTVTSPKVETSLKDVAGSMKDQALEQLDAKKKELEDKAKAEAERLKNEAETKAKAEADRIKKEAEAKARAEAEKAKKAAEEKLKKEAEDKLKNIFGKPKNP